MSKLNKILLTLGGIIIVGLLGFIVYQQIELKNKQLTIETQVVQQKELVDNIMRSQSSYASRDDINRFIANNGVNLKAVQNDLSKLQASVNSVNAVVIQSNGQHATDLPTTQGAANPDPHPIDPNNPDPYGYLSHQQNLQLNESFDNVQVPLGQVNFSAWKEKPWGLDLLPRQYNLVNVIGLDENQRSYVYNKFSVQVDGKTYDLKIQSAQTQQVYPESKFSWWNPRLFLGVDAGVSLTPFQPALTPSLDLGIMSYGRYLNQPDWVFLSAGLGYNIIDHNLQLLITPATYNIGKDLPLINNTYIGPSLGLETNGNISVMLGVKVGL